ncbi:MAG: roadblock/LC7 domain-containing protein [Nitrosomonadales bacterium]|nr:roadblock/LC7 domain-containing protein [Nitrosomonadales bacterium]
MHDDSMRLWRESPVFKAVCRAEMDELRNSTPSVQAGIIATADGFDVADVCVNDTYSPARLSAMASSMMALAGAVAREVEYPNCESLIVESSGGKTIMMSLPGTDGRLVLLVIADNSASFGMLLMHARQCAHRIQKRLNLTTDGAAES